MKRKRFEASKGVLALVLLAAIYGITAVMARYFSKGTGVFEQWYLRYAIGFVIAIAMFRKQIRFSKFLHLPKREWLLLFFRATLGSVIAVALYTLAAQQAKIGPVAFMQVLPTTALFGIVLFHEKLGLKKAAFLLLSFFGAAIVVVPSVHDLAGFSSGEVLSFISGACFSLVFVARKWHGKELNNQELTVALVGIGAVLNYILSLLLYHRVFATHADWSPVFAVALIAAGFLSVVMNFLSSYGFEHVSAVVASAILDLEQVFGVLFGYLFYRETLTVREVLGGAIILAAAIGMNQLNNRESKEQKVIPVPD